MLSAPESSTSRAEKRATHREPLIAIVRYACDAFGAPLSALLTGSRMNHVQRARMVAAFILRTDHKMSYPAVAKLLDTDHSTAMRAIRRCEDVAAVDPAFATAIEKVRAWWKQDQLSEVRDAAE